MTIPEQLAKWREEFEINNPQNLHYFIEGALHTWRYTDRLTQASWAGYLRAKQETEQETEWKIAMLDALAITCMDAPATMPPTEILAKVIKRHVDVARKQTLEEAIAICKSPVDCIQVTDDIEDLIYPDHRDIASKLQELLND